MKKRELFFPESEYYLLESISFNKLYPQTKEYGKSCNNTSRI